MGHTSPKMVNIIAKKFCRMSVCIAIARIPDTIDSGFVRSFNLAEIMLVHSCGRPSLAFLRVPFATDGLLDLPLLLSGMPT